MAVARATVRAWGAVRGGLAESRGAKPLLPSGWGVERDDYGWALMRMWMWVVACGGTDCATELELRLCGSNLVLCAAEACAWGLLSSGGLSSGLPTPEKIRLGVGTRRPYGTGVGALRTRNFAMLFL